LCLPANKRAAPSADTLSLNLDEVLTPEKQMSKRIFLFLLLLLYAGTLLKAQDGGPKMVITEPVFNAGNVYRTTDRLEHTFVVKNTGTANLEIYSVKPG
jgi:hypothetical protein